MQMKDTCPIWGTAAKIEKPDDQNLSIIKSPRAGGSYIVDAATLSFSALSIKQKILLTDWLVEQRRLGVEGPKITAERLAEVLNRRSLSVDERVIHLLVYINQKVTSLGDVVTFFGHSDGTKRSEKHEITAMELLAWTGSAKLTEVITLSEFAKEENFLDYVTTTRKSQKFGKQAGLVEPVSVERYEVHELMLKTGGFRKLASLSGPNTDSSQCLVAMWFHESMDEVYARGIAEAVRNCGYEPLRIDRLEHTDKIDDRIIAEIRRSRFMVADFTSEPKNARGGVYYEAGFAHGLGIPVIWTCKADLFKDIHFDTRQYNHIFWETTEDLRVRLTERIAAVIGDGPLKGRK